MGFAFSRSIFKVQNSVIYLHFLCFSSEKVRYFLLHHIFNSPQFYRWGRRKERSLRREESNFPLLSSYFVTFPSQSLVMSSLCWCLLSPKGWVGWEIKFPYLCERDNRHSWKKKSKAEITLESHIFGKHLLCFFIWGFPVKIMWVQCLG